MFSQSETAPPSGPQQKRHLPQAALVLVDGGEAVSVDSVEVVLVGDPWGDDFRVHNEALATGAALMQRLEAGRGRGGKRGGWLGHVKESVCMSQVCGSEATGAPCGVHGRRQLLLTEPAATIWRVVTGWDHDKIKIFKKSMITFFVSLRGLTCHCAVAREENRIGTMGSLCHA